MENESFPCIARFAESGEGLRDALGEMARTLYRNPRIYGLKDEDDVGELFARYPGRIEVILRKYQEARGYFPAYLIATVRFLALSLRRDRARSFDRQMVFEEEAALCAENPPGTDYIPGDPESPLPESRGRGPYRRSSLRSRFLYLSVKCAWTADEGFLRQAARSLGVDASLLSLSLSKARSRTLSVRDRWEDRKAARDASWVRLRVLERRLSREEDPCVRTILRERIERERERFRRRLEETRRMRLTISNKAVAEVLGIPKGTVDAGVYFAARRIRDFQSGPVGGKIPHGTPYSHEQRPQGPGTRGSLPGGAAPNPRSIRNLLRS